MALSVTLSSNFCPATFFLVTLLFFVVVFVVLFVWLIVFFVLFFLSGEKKTRREEGNDVSATTGC